jgi:hypothetical protein
MSDNLQVPVPINTLVASDDVNGVQYPRVKVSWGVDGAAVDASTSAPLPVSDPNLRTSVEKISSATSFVAITPSTSTVLSGFKGIYIGQAGTLVAIGANNIEVTFEVQAGQILPISPVKILPTSTAAKIVGLS